MEEGRHLWTMAYLLHAHYRSTGIDYRYCHLVKTRRRYDRTKYGARKHWELERCLNDDACPLDDATKWLDEKIKPRN